MDGFLVIDKPLGISSREAVDVVQGWRPGLRAGHTGTLDPLASGVLVLALGKATRLTEYVQRQAKVYRAAVELGATTSTDDAEGTRTPVPDAVPPDRAALDAALASFHGEILQVPPDFSAAHVRGRRAYRLARQGKPVELEPRPVRIDRIDVLAYEYPRLELEVECGKGTYIRSLARDLGRNLGCGGFLTALRRTRVGPFHVEDALPLSGPPADIAAHVRPLAEALAAAPQLRLDDARIGRLAQGQAIPWADEGWPPGAEVAVCDTRGNLVAVGVRDAAAGLLRPVKVVGPR